MNGIFSIVLAATVFVAPNGNDQNDGSSKAKPVKTPERALELIRGVVRDEPKEIVFADGIYYLEKPIDVEPQDVDLTIRAENPRKAILTAALKVEGWKKDPKDARMLVAPFPFEPKSETLYTLTVNGEPAEFSAYPQLGGTKKLRYLATDEDVAKKNRHVFVYDQEDLPGGGDYRDLDISSAFIFIPQEWASARCYIATNDWKNNTFYLKGNGSGMPLGQFNTGYQILNTRFGLKYPGCWMFSARDKQLVYWPKEGETPATIEAYVSCGQHLVSFDRTRNCTLRGFVCEGCSSPFAPRSYSRYGAAAVGAAHCHKLTIEDCEVRNCAHNAIYVISATDSTVRNCYVHHVGCCGIGLYDRCAGCVVEGNEVCHTGLFALDANGVFANSYNRIVGNHIHHTSGCGTTLWALYGEFSSNHLHHTMQSIRDGGGLYGAMGFSRLVGNYVHDAGNWPGLYLDEGAQRCVFSGNVYKDCWWPFHMHETYGIVMTNNVIQHDGGMRMSFQGSSHCVFKDNVIKTTLPITQDPYLNNTDAWDNEVQLKQQDGSYKSIGRTKLERKVLPPAQATAMRVTKSMKLMPNCFPDVWGFTGGGAAADRNAKGQYTYGVPGAGCMIGWDDETLYISGRYTYTRHTAYPGFQNLGGEWGVHDGVSFHFEKLSLSITFDKVVHADTGIKGGVISTNPDFKPVISNTSAVVIGMNAAFAAYIPLKAIGMKGKPKPGDSIPFNMVSYNGDHREYRYASQPDGDNLLTGRLVFKVPEKPSCAGFVTVKERHADRSCEFPGVNWPDGGVIQPGPVTCERPNEGYRQPTRFDNHNPELIGYVLAGRPKLQGFVTLPFSDKQDPVGDARVVRRMEIDSMGMPPGTCPGHFGVRTENWDLWTDVTASKNCAYLRYKYERGGEFRVALDAQVGDSAYWLKGRPATKVTAAESASTLR